MEYLGEKIVLHVDPNVLTFDVCREFSNERTRVERRETFRKLRMRENFSKVRFSIWRVSVGFLGQVQATFVLEFQQLSFQAFEGYFQWISKAGTF